MPNGSSTPLTPVEVLAKIQHLAKKYGYQKPGRGKRSVAPRIAREIGLSVNYTRKILNEQRRKVGKVQLTINSLTLVRSRGTLCRRCENPTYLYCFPSRLCVACELLELGKRGLIVLNDREPAIPDEIP